jgi:hypothetical protein
VVNELKNYIREQLKATDSKFSEHDDAFNSDNIPETKLDKKYFMTYSIATVENGTVMEETANFELQLFFKGLKKPLETLDKSMELANTFRLNLLNPLNIASYNSTLGGDFSILGIDSVNQESSELADSNDNSMIITIEFNMRFIQIVC